MATLVNLSGFEYGVRLDETSINIESLSVTVAPQFKEMLPDKANGNRGFVVGPLRREISMNGELSASSGGVLAFTFLLACSISNTVAYFGATTGTIFLDTATVNETRAGFKSVNLSLSADTGIVLA